MNRVLHVICSCSVNVAFASLSHGPYGTERPFIVFYWENPRMRGVRISASRAGKSRTALLETRTAPYDAVLEDFVAFKHPSYLLPAKKMQTTY